MYERAKIIRSKENKVSYTKKEESRIYVAGKGMASVYQEVGCVARKTR